jgi:hypothetical protein
VRQFIPITGGRFSGAGIRGEVMPGGADGKRAGGMAWWSQCALFHSHSDGAVIVVDNHGIIVPPPPLRLAVRSIMPFTCARARASTRATIRVAPARCSRHDHAGYRRRRRDHPRVPRADTRVAHCVAPHAP